MIASPITFSNDTATLIKVFVNIAYHRFVTQKDIKSHPTELNRLAMIRYDFR